MLRFNINVRSYKKEEIDQNELIRFLNTRAIAFYRDHCLFNQSVYKNHFKGNLQSAIIDIERTFRGTFGCDFALKSVDVDLLREMFPHAINDIFKVEDEDDLATLSAILTSFRNINSHAKVAKEKIVFKHFDFSRLIEEPKFNASITYFDDDITIAGMIYLIALFLRRESLEALIKKDLIFSYVISGSFAKDNGERFVEKISHVNLEIPIRTTKARTLKNAIFGEMKPFIEEDGDSFKCSIGHGNSITYRVNGTIGNASVTIDAGSLTHIAYKKDYILLILAKKEFIELSNQLPAFVLVDYLYAKNVSTFDKDEYNSVMKMFDRIEKLNHPKYYIDKNINIILLPETVSDYRLISSVTIDSLQRLFLSLEDYIYFNYLKEEPKEYSIFKKAIETLHVPTKLLDNLVCLRNFASHGYIINESSIYSESTIELTVPFIMSTLEEFTRFVKDNDSKLFNFYSRILRELVIEVITVAKYKKIIQTSREILTTYPNYDKETLKVKNSFVDRSMFDIALFNELAEIIDCKQTVAKLEIKSIPYPLYLTCGIRDARIIEEFCNKNGFEIKGKTTEPIQITYLIA